MSEERSPAPLDEPRLSLEVNRQIGDLQREGLTGHALALLNRCYLIIKGFEDRLYSVPCVVGTPVDRRQLPYEGPTPNRNAEDAAKWRTAMSLPVDIVDTYFGGDFNSATLINAVAATQRQYERSNQGEPNAL